MERTYVNEAHKHHGKSILLKGFVHEVRDIGKLKFLLLRDITGIIQITAHKDKTKEELFKKISKISRESSVEISGEVKSSKQAPGGYEIIPEKIEVLNESENLPIDISERSKTELPKRLDWRSVDLHSLRTQAIFKIQSTIANSFREYFLNQNFIEIQPPCIISTSSEGGTDLFPVMYFEKQAFLAQSPQLYKQAGACTLEKVFSITPVWRAEKHNTVRHLNEIRQMDIEVCFADEFAVMKYLEESIKFIVKSVLEKNKRELEVLNIKLKIPHSRYITYDDALKLLQKDKIKIKHGDDFTPEAEKKLCGKFEDSVVFVYDYPLSLKPFYIMPKEKLSKGFDALYGGLEISSGGQRIHLPDLLAKRIKEKGLNPENFKSYIDSFRFGAPPHAGWAIGLERLTQIITNQDNIREVAMFPRDRDRLIP